MESPLSKWESFYVIVGSSAGALTGLQFVVMALVAEVAGRSAQHRTRQGQSFALLIPLSPPNSPAAVVVSWSEQHTGSPN